MSEEDKNKRQEKLTGNCNTFYVEGIRCQGYTEKRYFQFLVATNSVLSKSKRLGIKTPFGYCFPDFDFENFYVEIKSSYNFQRFMEDKNI